MNGSPRSRVWQPASTSRSPRRSKRADVGECLLRWMVTHIFPSVLNIRSPNPPSEPNKIPLTVRGAGQRPSNSSTSHLPYSDLTIRNLDLSIMTRWPVTRRSEWRVLSPSPKFSSGGEDLRCAEHQAVIDVLSAFAHDHNRNERWIGQYSFFRSFILVLPYRSC